MVFMEVRCSRYCVVQEIIIYVSWSPSTDRPTLVTTCSSIEVLIGSRLDSTENPRLMSIRTGNTAEKVEKVRLDRVGLWKQPSPGPNIRLLELCGAGGACRKDELSSWLALRPLRPFKRASSQTYTALGLPEILMDADVHLQTHEYLARQWKTVRKTVSCRI